MKHFNLKDFNEAFFKVNEYYIDNPQQTDGIRGLQVLYDDIVITTESTNCDKIDIGALGYAKQKWSHLVRTYVDKDKLQEFRDKIEKSGGLSIAYDFNRKDSANGSCLREIVLTRTKGKDKPFTKAKIFYRVTELHRRYAADLILLSQILNSLPQVELEQITLFIPQAYHSAHILPILDIWGFDFKEIIRRAEKSGEKNLHRMVMQAWTRSYNPKTRKPSKFSYTIRMQDFYDRKFVKKEKHTKLTYKELEL